MTPTARTTLVIVDDDAFTRRGICQYLTLQGFTVLEAGDAATAEELVTQYRPGAVVLDIQIPRTPNDMVASPTGGVQLARQLKKINPSLGIVLFTAYHDRGGDLFLMMSSGVRGVAYKLKGCRPQAVLDAIRDVIVGRVIIDPEVTSQRELVSKLWSHLTPDEYPWVQGAVNRMNELTAREWEVAQSLAASYNGTGIADSLNFAPKTVENVITDIYKKLGLGSLIDQKPPHLRKVLLLAKACLIWELQRGEK